jgi:hypothetical protein
MGLSITGGTPDDFHPKRASLNELKDTAPKSEKAAEAIRQIHNRLPNGGDDDDDKPLEPFTSPITTGPRPPNFDAMAGHRVLQAPLAADQHYRDRQPPPPPAQFRSQPQPQYQPPRSENELIMDKLNFIVNLLEDQQDAKTATVTEEVVLYSFLGIFMIFVVDSFTRAGKYTR